MVAKQQFQTILPAKNQLLAVIGVSSQAKKYGYKIFTDLLAEGYKLVGVNPKGGVVSGQKIYTSLKLVVEEFEKPEWLILVVPPLVSKKVVLEGLALNINNFWFQPGSESVEVRQLLEDVQANFIIGSCLMHKAGLW